MFVNLSFKVSQSIAFLFLQDFKHFNFSFYSLNIYFEITTHHAIVEMQLSFEATLCSATRSTF